jgi:hypothetical protein
MAVLKEYIADSMGYAITGKDKQPCLRQSNRENRKGLDKMRTAEGCKTICSN